MYLEEWAAKHGVSRQALSELVHIYDHGLTPRGVTGEAGVQSLVRLEAANAGCHLFRNNVGVLTDKNGRPVRYGLANDSKLLNERIKSADLIGWRRVVIQPHHVGSTIAQFLSRECKAPGWRYNPNDKHEAAQMAWARLVAANGGDAAFATGLGSL